VYICNGDIMLHTKPTYKDLLSQNEKLRLENKRLRLRPSMHSTDANVIEFINIKNQLALSTLKASNLYEAIDINISYLLKIPNMHAVAFFKYTPENNTINIINEKGLTKSFTHHVNQQQDNSLINFIFPNNTEAYYSKNIATNENFKHLQRFNTLVVMPILQEENNKISILLASMKEFGENDFFKFLYESVLVQLKSSFLRIHLNDKLKNQSLELEKQIKSRTTNFERLNRELVLQITTHKKNEQRISEELDLFKSIITQQKDLVLRINTEGQISYSNPQFSNVKVMHSGDKDNLLSYFGNGDFPGLELILTDFERGAQRVNCDIQLLNTKKKWFSFYFSPVKNKRGLITDIQVVARNIDKNKKEQHHLQMQKDMLYHMLDTLDKILFSFNDEGKILLSSNTFTRKTGHHINDISNKNIFDLIHPDDIAPIELFLQKKTKQNPEKFRIRFRFADQSWHSLTLEIKKVVHSISPLRYNLGTICLK